jgi:hypothetical protein
MFGLMGMSAAFAQVSTATLSGTITDSSGSVVPHVKVTIRNTDTNAVRALESDDQGRYNAPDLPVGNYEMEATLTGFQTFIQKGIQLTVGEAVVANVALQVGTAQQTVEVTADVQGVQTTTSDLGSLVDQHQMRDLPLNGRNYNQLILMAPGVSSYSAPGVGNQPLFSVAGLRPEGQSILLDGTNVLGWFNQGGGNATAGSSLGIDAIAEFQVLTNTYGAQYGGSGAIINQVTKSGTNSLHGSVYEFLRNSALDARNYFDPPGSVPPFRRNQFGGTLGGPLKKDKLFFFANYEGLRQGLANTITAFVPDSNARNGFLPCAIAGPAYTCNPSTQLAAVPFSPFVQNSLFPLYPAANGPEVLSNGGPSGVAEYIWSPGLPTNEDFFVGRIDYNFSDSHSFFVRYLFDNAASTVASTVPGFPTDNSSRNQFITLADRKIFSPTFINVVNFSFTRNSFTTVPGETPPAALEYLPGRPAGTLSSALSPLGDSIIIPALYRPNRFTISDGIDWTRGAHAMHFGFEVRRSQLNGELNVFLNGEYIFTSLPALMAGTPVAIIMTPPGQTDSSREFRETGLTPYFQDDWKVTRRLTLNLGLRYSYMTDPTEVHGEMSLAYPLLTATGFSEVPRAFQHNPSTLNFDPRFGFAWDIFGDQKTSLRGGYGIFHDVISQRVYAQAFFIAPPYNIVSQGGPAVTFPHPTGLETASPLPLGANNWSIDSTPYAEEYNLNIQRELPGDAILTVGYVGSHGLHLLGDRDFNACNPISPGGSVRPIVLVPSTCSLGRPNNNLSTFPTIFADYISNYNSLQASVTKRWKRGIDFFASYTYSKALDDASAAYGMDAAGYSGTTENPLNLRQDYGPASFDLRHNFISNLLYRFPFQGNRWVEGWQLSVIGTAHTGEPYTVQENFDWPQTGDSSAVSRPDEISNPNAPGSVSGNPGCVAPVSVHTPTAWFNPCAFALQPIGTFGNEGRNSLTGPGFTDFDFALIKDTRVRRISDSFDVQFRAEFFNIFNHANFALPGPTSGGTTIFTGASCTPPALGSPCSGGAQPVGVFSPSSPVITSTLNSSRQIQFGVKLTF